MSKINSYETTITEKLQDVAARLGWTMMLGATMLGGMEIVHSREKAVVPVVADVSLAGIHESKPVNTDDTLRREKENEVGAHGAIYNVGARTQSRSGRQ